MGKRKAKAKPVAKKRMDKLDTVFSCPFCNHGSSVECRMLHAQALTLAALAGAGVVEYYDHKSGAKVERYAKFLDPNPYVHKD